MSKRVNAAIVFSVLACASALGACSSSPGSDSGGGGAGTGSGSSTPPPGAGAAGSGAAPSGAAGSGTKPVATGAAGSTAPSGGAGTSSGDAMGTAGMMGGEAGTSADAAGTTGGAAGTMGGDMREDQGEGDGQDVVTIGDSYMNLNGVDGTEMSLDKITPTMYRPYAVPGTMILDGAIPSQWDQAKRANPNIKTVVMTGGGNDIILNLGNLAACGGAATEADLSAGCLSALDDITAGVTDLINQLEKDGVQDVFYMGYAHVTFTELGGTLERTKHVQEMNCKDYDPARTIRCHFVDPADEIGTMIMGDGIHPTAAGYDAAAKKVYARMVSEGARR